MSSLGRLLTKWAEFSHSRLKYTYAILHCNFMFTNFNCLAIYVISVQTVTNDHFFPWHYSPYLLRFLDHTLTDTR
jgi:hypothetical protein